MVGADGLVIERDMAKDVFAQRRPFDAKLKATRFRAGESVAHAGAVIVIVRRKLEAHADDVMLLSFVGNSFRRIASRLPHLRTY